MTTTDRIHIEEPKRDEKGQIIPGHFVRKLTVETPPKPIEWVIEEAKTDLKEDRK